MRIAILALPMLLGGCLQTPLIGVGQLSICVACQAHGGSQINSVPKPNLAGPAIRAGADIASAWLGRDKR